MHYLTYVFIPAEGDIDEAVATALEPFGDDFAVEPWKRRLDAGEITAMAKHYGVQREDLQKLAEKMEDWNGGTGGVDDSGLFAMLAYNPNGKWDWYETGGRWAGRMRDNVATAPSLLQSPTLADCLPHDFLTPDGEWHAKSTYVSTGWLDGHIVETASHRWLEEFRQALADWPHHRVVSVDGHS